MDALTDLGISVPDRLVNHAYSVHLLAQAMVKARRIRPDGRLGDDGTYDDAAEALDWLLSDAFHFLDRIGAAETVLQILERIKYKELFERIAAAAKRSRRGRRWLEEPAFHRLEELVRQADIYFKARGARVAV